MPTLTLDALTERTGVEVHGLDLATGSSGSAADIEALREAYATRHLLLLRGPVVTGEEQTAFVARFGPLVPERGLWGHVSNVRADGIVREGALLFHSDFAFTPTPVWGISLHALDVPPSGTSTGFANATAAALPADLRARLAGRRVVNFYDFGGRDDARMALADAAPGSPVTEVAAIGRHPRTGVDVVLANEMHTDHVVGVPPAESAALLTDLFAALYDDTNVYEHHWQTGDLVLWDNIALHHGRRAFPPAEPRTLRRVTLGPLTPSESVPGLADLLVVARGGAAAKGRN